VRRLDEEALARPEARAALPFASLLRLYLDPFVLLKSAAAAGPAGEGEALRYNRTNRGLLVAYMRRWALVALACLGSVPLLGAAAPSVPLLWIPAVAAALGFSAAVCVFLLAAAVYVVLGLDG